jgi:hypothetical protein
MLSARDARRDTGRRRAPPSQKQQYDEYVLQRIEAFKNSISREELMRMAGEAAAELHAGMEGQFLLTELLMTDMVDALIRKRLRLKSFRRWREQFGKLRQAQREPTHWGLDRNCPLVHVVSRLEPSDHALVVGRGAEACAYLLAAFDVDLTFWDSDVGIVERVEQKMVDECLSSRSFACCVPLEGWMPSVGSPFAVIVLDLEALAAVEAHVRPGVLAQLQQMTAEGGAHVLLPGRTLVPEALNSAYPEWAREKLPSPVRRGAAPRGAVMVKPVPQEVRRAQGA